MGPQPFQRMRVGEPAIGNTGCDSGCDARCDARWQEATAAIIGAGRRMDVRGWVPATSGNISCRLPDGRIAITRSGGHKGLLTTDGVIEVAADGSSFSASDRPSAETLLHTQLYAAFPDVRAVVHGHSVAATVLSMVEPGAVLQFAAFELLKIFDGQTTHHTALDLPLFDNDQDIARLCTVITPRLSSMRMGYVIRGHGVYVWGPSMDVALARLEGLEFLLACELERRKLRA